MMKSLNSVKTTEISSNSTKIHDVDYWEKDGLITINGKTHYFQFASPNNLLEQALHFIKHDQFDTQT